MNSEGKFNVLAGALACGILGLYLIWSYTWYRERMFHFDAAFYTFRVFQLDAIFYYHDRYINALTQWVPIMARRMGADLVGVARAYSMTLPVIHVAAAVGLFLWRRSAALPLLMLVAVLASLRYRFFSPISETHMVLLFSSLYFLLVQFGRPGKKLQIWSLVAIALVSISHPVGVLPVMILWAFNFVTKPERRERWLEMAGIVLLFGWRFVMAMGNSYESQKLGVLKSVFSLPSKWGDLVVPELLGNYLFGMHAVPWLLFVACVVWLYTTGKKIWAVMSLASAVVLLLLVLVTYSYISFPVYHMLEGYLSFVSLVWLVPLVLLYKRGERQWVVILSGLMLVSGLWSVRQVKPYYTAREQYILEICKPWQEKGNKRLVMTMEKFPWRQLWYHWAVPFESVLMTASKDKRSTATLFFPEQEANFELVQRESDYFFGPFEHLPMELLDTNYFLFPRQPYLNISESDLPRDFFQ